MKFKGILIACLLLTFLDVVSIDACGRTHYPDPNQDKGNLYIFVFYKENKTDETYKQLDFNVIDAIFTDGDVISINSLNGYIDNLFKDNFTSENITSYQILDVYKFNDFESNLDEASSITENDSLTITSDLVLTYNYGIRGAYHVAVVIDATFGK